MGKFTSQVRSSQDDMRSGGNASTRNNLLGNSLLDNDFDRNRLLDDSIQTTSLAEQAKSSENASPTNASEKKNPGGVRINWSLTSMAQDGINKTYTIDYNIRVHRDLILVNQSSKKVEQSIGNGIAAEISKRRDALSFGYLFKESNVNDKPITDFIKMQYSHIPKDYKINVNTYIQFTTGTSTYVDNISKVPANTSSTLMGIRDDVSDESNYKVAGRAVLGGSASVVEVDNISPTDIDVPLGGTIFKKSSTPQHEYIHNEGAGDLYEYNKKGVKIKDHNSLMGGGGSTDLSLSDVSKREIASRYLFAARYAHNMLLGDDIGDLKKEYTLITQSADYKKNPAAGGWVQYSTQEQTSLEQLKGLD